MTRLAIALVLSCALGSCAGPSAAPHDPHARQALLDSVKALEGRWEEAGPDGKPQVTEFKVSSNGSVVREIMFPGTPHEMTNVYRLDGNALALTHYCSMGNQPEMRATAREGNKLRFSLVSVADLEAPDEMYMGELTLEFVDADHVNEHWRSFAEGVAKPEHAADLTLTRRK